MSPVEVEQLEALFQNAGVGWYFNADKDVRAEKVAGEIREVQRLLTGEFLQTVDLWKDMTEKSALLEPLIQAFASPMTNPIRAVIYCVMTGASFSEIEYRYRAKNLSSLHVKITLTTGQEIACNSDDLWDAEILRHLGMAKVGGRPLIDGYYAFRKQDW